MEKFIRCECGSLEHTVHFQASDFIEGPDWPELIINVHLVSHDNFFKRLWVGLRYALGYNCKYGHWDEVLLWQDKIIELRDYLNEILCRTTTKT